jgi:hypothetical protein
MNTMSSPSASAVPPPTVSVNLYETMVWLSRTVRPKPDASECTSTSTKTYSTYEKQKCTPVKSVKLLQMEDPQHPLKVLERYKVAFEKIPFSDIPDTSRSVLGMSTETEWDVENNLSKRTPDPRTICNEGELVGFYEHHVLWPAVEMVKVVLASNQCPKELEGLAASGLLISIRSPRKFSAAPCADKEVVLMGRRPLYDRKVDVALPTDVKVPSVLNEQTPRAISKLVVTNQDGWQEFGLQGVERGFRPKGATTAVKVSPFNSIPPSPFFILTVVKAFSHADFSDAPYCLVWAITCMLVVYRTSEDETTLNLTQWMGQCEEDIALLTALILEGLKGVWTRRQTQKESQV